MSIVIGDQSNHDNPVSDRTRDCRGGSDHDLVRLAGGVGMDGRLPIRQVSSILETAEMWLLGQISSGLPSAMLVRASPGFPGSLVLTPRSGLWGLRRSLASADRPTDCIVSGSIDD